MTNKLKAFVLRHKKQLAWYDRGETEKLLAQLNEEAQIASKDTALTFLVEEWTK